MNTNKLKSFSQIARRILMEGVSRRITYYGFDAKGKVIDEPIAVPGGVIIREEIIDDATVPAKWQALRAAIQRHGVEAVVEEAAYTWFNRLMAMQILAKNNYDPTQLEYESAGSVTPVILARARRGMISYLDRTEQKRVQPLVGDYQNEQKAFAILLTGYCHHHQLLNRIFGRLDDYTELLLPDNILAESGLIYLLNTSDAITNEDYGQVELIGWLYQFYISEKKDQVFASFKKNQKAEAEDIPAATQIFTPNWIVKYMVQNTVGRIWLDHRPSSFIKQKMKYLVESPENADSEDHLPPSGGTDGGFIDGVESLKLLDPACGSGHILVEGFFHLYDIYEEEYYMPAEAVEKILQHNLFGLDIDLRAAQLAQFAVLLAAATKYPDILKKEIAPHIYAMPEAAAFSREEILDFLGSEGTQHEKILTRALELMQQAKNLGSVMQFNVTPAERQFMILRLETLQTEARTSLMVQSLLNKIQPFLQVLFIMSDRYEAIAANPPYLGPRNMNSQLKDYLETKYPLSKSDLFAVFIESAINLNLNFGKIGMINQESWLFNSSYKGLRKKIILNFEIESLLHLGTRAFDELSGEKVRSVTFILNNTEYKNNGTYFKLTDFNNSQSKNNAFLNRNKKFENVNQQDFLKIAGSPFAYWISPKVLYIFKNNKNLSNYSEPRKGNSTSDNDRFLKLWHEINNFNFAKGYKDLKQALSDSKIWIPYNKGGGTRKWYGQNEYLIDWTNNGDEIRKIKTAVVTNEKYYMKPGLTWSAISSKTFGIRYFDEGFIFDNNGCCLFELNENRDYLAALLNSKVFFHIIGQLNPALAFHPGDVKKFPVIHKKINDILSVENLKISKSDWDFHETSWDFQLQPLLAQDKPSIEFAYTRWQEQVMKDFFQLHANEVELNHIFIGIYGLQDEITPEVKLQDITILQDILDRSALVETEKELRKHHQWKLEDNKWHLYVDGQLQSNLAEGELPHATVQPSLPIKKNVVMQQLISYAVGCMLGRYSLDAPGLILANQGETMEEYKAKVKSKMDKEGKDANDSIKDSEEGFTFMPDDDGIIPLMGSNCGFSDDAALRLRHFIEAVWGSETLTQNINFLQACLDMEIEKYLVNQSNFWKDHCSRYKKKPIYWLFSSKNGAFQVLTYMHRMNRFTVQKIRETYMFKHLQWLANQKADLERRSATLSRDDTRQLDYYRTALNECQEYDLQLKNIADQQIEFDLDDGVTVNYAKFEPLLAGIK